MILSNSKIRSQSRATNKTPFNLLKEMEGDGPTGAFVLANYHQAIKDLKKKEAAGARENAFHPMYHKMIKKLEEY
ncbi:hypothetical protein VP01_995g5 [Puccinia sorghi]|uniref:Uncharacterized protein n=1 Tax=Puccinia sorghi TaxID=27349 RepID=A0A0L6U5A2_9BASI|nr:hypothetical protein VP01_995g5 [Puccinia sorghi]